MYVAQRCYKWMGWGWDWVGQPGKGEYKAPYGANKKVWIIIKQRENRESQSCMKLNKYETESSSGRKESDICRWCSEDECGYSDVSLILVMSDEKRLRLEDNLCRRLRLEDAPLSVPCPPLFYSFGKHTSLKKRILGHPQISLPRSSKECPRRFVHFQVRLFCTCGQIVWLWSLVVPLATKQQECVNASHLVKTRWWYM